MTFQRAFCENLSSGKTRILFNDKITKYDCVAITSIDPTKFNRLDEINDVSIIFMLPTYVIIIG